MNFDEQWLEEYYKRQGKQQPGVILAPAEKKSKYGNKKVKVDGFWFASQLEADYYADLKTQLRAGVILGFCRQPRFALTDNMEYVADFIVFNLDGKAEIIDTKGFETDVFKLKAKMFADKYPKLKLEVVKC